MADEDPTLSPSIDGFFLRSGLKPETRLICDAFLRSHYPEESYDAAPTQGYCSYTVASRDRIVQFRPAIYPLDLNIISIAKDVYQSYAPATAFVATLSPPGFLVYTMEKMPGMSYKEYRKSENSHGGATRLTLCEDFAVFLARSWHQSRKDFVSHGLIGSSIKSRLEQLAKELPVRFRAAANRALSNFHLMKHLPIVLAHGDIVPSNIMLESCTGHLYGLVDWAEAELLPFGICLYGLEEILGYMSDGSFTYHLDAERGRDAFWAKLHEELPQLKDEQTHSAVRIARDIGVLLWHGFAFDDGARSRVVQDETDLEEVCYLDTLLYGANS